MLDILETLYRERILLKEKLEKLEALIVSYGGTLTTGVATNSATSLEVALPEKTGIEVQNLQNASWKQKIIAAINALGKPGSVVEITDWLHKIEPSSERAKIHKSVTLYCSSLSIKGELGVDKTGEVNRYFISTD
jgi:hypothetical protein